MSPSAESHPGAAIVAYVSELEASLEATEELLVARAWPELEMQLSDQRRITHAISNAVALSEDQRPASFELELKRRLQAIETRRADQLLRLQAFHDAVGSRLAVMARAKAMRRATGPPAIDRPALLDSRQ
ncbi:MAG: hypothetical protein NVSMB64_04780 [Candidatus Velthaea sp.]